MQSIAERLNHYRAFLTDEQTRLKHEIALFEQQNRQDEANLLKVRLNIFCVFETVAQADEKQTASLSNPWAAFCQRYEPRFDTLTAPWRKRLAAASAHGDVQTQIIEETKLAAAACIKQAFDSLKE